MTREEAIKQLRLLKGDITFGIASKVENKNQIEALSIAIASLETDEAYQLEYEQPKFCKDCISREEVYYYISSHINEIITESGTDKNAHTNAILRSLANGVKTMPSVLPKVTKNDLGVSSGLKNVSPIIDWNNCHTPEQLDSIATTKNDLANDCISRIETIDYLCKHCPDDGECFKDCDEIKHLRQMPSVTPQEPKSEWEQDHEILKAYSDGVNEVLDKIRAEIDNALSDGMIHKKTILGIIDKYKAETEQKDVKA